MAADLERDGCDVWVDDVKLHIGDSIPEKVHDAIQGSHFVVAVLSRISVCRPWVREELRAAVAASVEKGERFVLPCVIEACDVPSYLRDKVYADFVRLEYPHAYAKLRDAILPGGARTADVAVEHLRWGITPDTRAMAAAKLGVMRSVEAVPHLIKALADVDSQVRKEVAKALGYIGSETAVLPLVAILNGDCQHLRIDAIQALGRIGSTSAVAPLEETLLSGSDMLAAAAA